MKKTIVLFLAIILLSSMTTIVFAADRAGTILDRADLLTSKEENILNDRGHTISSEHSLAILILTVDS